ncbi:MAG: MFS transporter [Proteobacteria bacterium]|nr:MFS transporter [Burkholderiales bacterium]
MDTSKKNVVVLAGCQAITQVKMSMLIAIAGLSGYALATDKTWATLPITVYVIGSALATLPSGTFMKRFGRRTGFSFGALFGIGGGVVCALALWLESFWVLCLGTAILGVFVAFGRAYRFAAADAAPKEFKAKAISLVLAGGIVGGILGPNLANWTKDLWTGLEFGAPFLVISLLSMLTLLVLRPLQIPPLTVAERAEPGRPIGEIMRQPAFIVAVTASAVGYGVMNLLMVATPLAMHHHDYEFGSMAFVLEWHLIGMFAPSFFTGHLITRFGLLPVMVAGAMLNLVCIGIALSGDSVTHFWSALLILGVGWNFLFTGGSALLTETYLPAEREKTQSMHDFITFATMAVTSLVSGAMLSHEGWGWHAINYGSLPFIAAVLIAIAWIAPMRRLRVPTAS